MSSAVACWQINTNFTKIDQGKLKIKQICILNPKSTRLIMLTLICVISMEFMSPRGRRSSWQNVLSGEERRETTVFAGLACPVCLSVYPPIYLSDEDKGLTQSVRSPGCLIPRCDLLDTFLLSLQLNLTENTCYAG